MPHPRRLVLPVTFLAGTLLFNPGLRNYLLNVAQFDELLPTSRPLS